MIPPKLQAGRDAIQAIVEKVGAVQLKHSVGEDLAARIKFGLVEVVYEWAKGMVGVMSSFNTIYTKTVRRVISSHSNRSQL